MPLYRDKDRHRQHQEIGGVKIFCSLNVKIDISGYLSYHQCVSIFFVPNLDQFKQRLSQYFPAKG